MINDHLSVSKPALELLKGIEVLRLHPYDDQTGRKCDTWCKGATAGYGHLISKSEWAKFKDGISIAQANEIFAEDVKPTEQAIKSKVISPLSQQQYDALVLLVFNIGVGEFSRSSALKLINDKTAVTNYQTLELAWKAFRKAQGKINNGLVNRRASEWKLWKYGIYERW